jgi:peptide/nickel transport system permease protein
VGDAVAVTQAPSRPSTGPGWEPTRQRPALVDVLIRLVKYKPLGLLGGIVILLLLLMGIFASVLAPYGYNDTTLSARLSPPSPEHLMGTDNTGRDVFSRVIYGARISMTVGLAAAALHVLVGFSIGGTTGFYGGKVDTLLQRVVDAIQAFPSLILYLTVMSVVGQGLLPVILVLGLSSGVFGSRTIRGAVLGIRGNTYIEAAAAIGSPRARTLVKHVLPNVMALLIIEFTLAVGRMILAEAMLSFLGFGVPPPFPSWGGMLSNAGQRYMLQAPWMALWPGLALALACFSINMLGDALRDILDPRLRSTMV